MFIGIEIASSPLQNINDYRPGGGRQRLRQQRRSLARHAKCRTGRTRSSRLAELRDAHRWQRSSAGAVPPPSAEARWLRLAFALRCNARRGRPLRAGDLRVDRCGHGCPLDPAGQSAEAIFTGIGSLRCVAVPMTPVPDVIVRGHTCPAGARFRTIPHHDTHAEKTPSARSAPKLRVPAKPCVKPRHQARRNATINDIARLASVSKKTVSRVINQSPLVQKRRAPHPGGHRQVRLRAGPAGARPRVPQVVPDRAGVRQSERASTS
jgi:hypothetical protein